MGMQTTVIGNLLTSPERKIVKVGGEDRVIAELLFNIRYIERWNTGIERMRRGLHAWQTSGAELHLPTWHAALAEGLLSVGGDDEAGELVDQHRAVDLKRVVEGDQPGVFAHGLACGAHPQKAGQIDHAVQAAAQVGHAQEPRRGVGHAHA